MLLTARNCVRRKSGPTVKALNRNCIYMPNLLNVGIQFRNLSASMMLTGVVALAALMLFGNLASAQTPVLKLRMPFDDTGTGTTTPSDSGGGVNITMFMLSGTGAARSEERRVGKECRS